MITTSRILRNRLSPGKSPFGPKARKFGLYPSHWLHRRLSSRLRAMQNHYYIFLIPLFPDIWIRNPDDMDFTHFIILFRRSLPAFLSRFYYLLLKNRKIHSVKSLMPLLALYSIVLYTSHEISLNLWKIIVLGNQKSRFFNLRSYLLFTNLSLESEKDKSYIWMKKSVFCNIEVTFKYIIFVITRLD